MKHCISVDEEKKRNRKVTISDAQLLTEIMEAFLAIGEATNMVFGSEFSIEAGPKIANPLSDLEALFCGSTQYAQWASLRSPRGHFWKHSKWKGGSQGNRTT
jgi:hypothetical protein